MANILTNIISKTPINNSPSMQAKPAYTIDTAGKVKPLEDKAQLLPSRIFGSPISYAKELKQDVLNIGKAAKGKANDHELGRINDLAMKAGSLALASYLFAKNPFKLGKAMEVVGAGSFFATMALWPKLAIQAPIKARTGVDIHQKYIDSQGRKKMLHQDPQYDLTDLYSKEDLNVMGQKLKVDESLPDRNRFIKQRAKKTAIQGNTLWMMTAGLATPLGSALMCNALEQPVSTGIEKANLALSKSLLNNANLTDKIAKQTAKMDAGFVSKFCKEHADEALTPDMIDKLASRMTKGFPAEIKAAVKEQISGLASSNVTEATLTSVLEKCGVSKAVISDMNSLDMEGFVSSLAKGPKACRELKTFIQKNGGKTSNFAEVVDSVRKSNVSVGQLETKLTSLADILGEARAKNGVISKFISERVGDVQNSHIANQWGRTTKKFVKTLGLTDKELKAVSKGDFTSVEKRLSELANNPSKFREFEQKFLKSVDEYDKVTGESFIKTIKTKTDSLFEATGKKLTDESFTTVAEAFKTEGDGSVARNIVSKAADRALGAKSSFYRMFQAVDVRKGDVLKDALRTAGIADDRIEDLVKVAKKVSFEGTTADFVEKFKNCGFELSNKEFVAVSKALFEKSNNTTARKGFAAYCAEFIDQVINRDNGVVLDNAFCNLGAKQRPMYERMNTLVGSSIKETLQSSAKNIVNSRTWLKITGGAFAVLTVGTLLATLALGKKGKTEKQVEESNKVNG